MAHYAPGLQPDLRAHVAEVPDLRARGRGGVPSQVSAYRPCAYGASSVSRLSNRAPITTVNSNGGYTSNRSTES